MYTHRISTNIYFYLLEAALQHGSKTHLVVRFVKKETY